MTHLQALRISTLLLHMAFYTCIRRKFWNPKFCNNTECLKKSWHLWIVCQIEYVKHFLEMFICMDGKRSRLSYDTKKYENNLLLWWALATLFIRVWKLGCARIGCPFWLSEKSPNIDIDDGLVNLWFNYDGYGFVPCMTCPTSCPCPTQLHTTPPYPTTCTITSPITSTQQYRYHYQYHSR